MKTTHAPETFRYHRTFKDTVSVQKRHNYVNDDEVHEENPHLEDFLVPHHSVHIDPRQFLVKPTLARPHTTNIHNADCPSRHSCEVTEKNRHVSFHQVVVRQYGMILGDHPNCSYGPPVTLEWDYLEYEPLPLDEYEYHHARRRPLKLLILNYFRRKAMLLADENYTKDELKKATRKVDRTKRQRAITKNMLMYRRVEDIIETAGRRLKRIFKKELPGYTWDTKHDLDSSRHSSTSVLKR
jgi:hypothetical protein